MIPTWLRDLVYQQDVRVLLWWGFYLSAWLTANQVVRWAVARHRRHCPHCREGGS
jgi:hypothetical protein